MMTGTKRGEKTVKRKRENEKVDLINNEMFIEDES
jgi:hypothetical protein